MPCRDQSRKKPGVTEEQEKPGIQALGRVESRLKGCVGWDKGKRGRLLCQSIIFPPCFVLCGFLFGIHIRILDDIRIQNGGRKMGREEKERKMEVIPCLYDIL